MKKTTPLLIAVLLASFFMVLSEHTASSQQVTENTWKSLKPVPDTISDRAIAVNGQIHVIGHTKHYVYDPAKDQWTTKQPLPTTRSYFGIATYQDKIYTIGGAYRKDNLWVAIDVVEAYDPKNDSWETKTPMPTARSNLCANEIDGKIYLIGGSQTGYSFGVNEVYDIVTDTWQTKNPLPTPVGYYVSAVVDDKIYILGGNSGLDLNQIYDPKTDTWSTGAPMPHGAHWAAAVATTGQRAPKRIYVLGGVSGTFAYNTTQVYNPKTDTWTLGTEMLTAKCQLTTAVVNDIIYAIGGRPTVWDPLLPTNERYIPYGYGTIDQPNTNKTPEPPKPDKDFGLTLISPKNKTYYGPSSIIALEFSSKEPLSWVGYRLDNKGTVEVLVNTTLGDLPLGSHHITVYTTDTDGNLQTTQTTHFTIEQAITSPLYRTLTITVIIISITLYIGLLIHHKKQKHKSPKTIPPTFPKNSFYFSNRR
ncbi:kelch repeat-containing protein [Candidatus Bathycorpusculum sp.]|uniref:Kelch repeat-containing protein n=1 Tax=Candidatus Bathycorpusculum sp. TaxID=2994959 RepID=UPI0028222614|nr:hypothetical protein [Candidatus Termitimicrobium sp.]MCL2432855.1 hypothetical protein [Candidatus Termitimicrobium sp.]